MAQFDKKKEFGLKTGTADYKGKLGHRQRFWDQSFSFAATPYLITHMDHEQFFGKNIFDDFKLG